MIGHTFATSGAVTLAVAPSAQRADDYVVLASYEGQYVVATLDIGRVIEAQGAPDHWMAGEYRETRDEAIALFRSMAGLAMGESTMRKQVERAERLIAERATSKAGA